MKDILLLIQADTLVHCTVVMYKWHTARTMSQFSLQGWNPHPLHWRRGVSTTGPSGKVPLNS